MRSPWPWATPWQRGDPIATGRPTPSNGLGSPARCKWPDVGATGDGAVVRSVQRSERVLHEDLGPRKLSTISHMAMGGSKAVAYASTAALDASPVVWGEVAVLMCWTALCRRAQGHDSAHTTKVMAHPIILEAGSPTQVL